MSPTIPRLCMLLLGLSGGCQSESSPQTTEKRPRPVTVFELRQTEPAALVQYTGSVSSWKTEEVGFEVSGRVEYIIEPGTDVDGPQLNESGDRYLTETGELIARLDPLRFEARLASAQARVDTEKARLGAADRELQQVVPKQIRAAEAAVTLARQEFERYSSLLAQKATPQAQFDKAQANLDTTQAELDQLDAVRAVKESERASIAAQVVEAEEEVRQAQRDLDNTVLYAPFTGQAAEVFETLGGVVQAGQPVVKVQMMDPIQVGVDVSAKTDQTLSFSDTALVFPPDGGDPMEAIVWEKAGLADPSTRTFLVTLLIRNSKLLTGMPDEYDPSLDVRTRNLWGLYSKLADLKPPFFVNVAALHEDAEGYFLWRAANASRDMSTVSAPSQLKVEKVRVTPGTERIPFLNVATLRELSSTQDLDPKRDLFIGQLRDMDGDPLEPEVANMRLEKSGVVHFVRERWRFRPGDVVSADLGGAPLKAGYYVPMSCLSRGTDGTATAVYIVELSGTGSVATKVPVRVFTEQYSGTHVRIEPAEEQALAAGTPIIAAGAHYVIDGEPVRVTRTVEVGP